MNKKEVWDTYSTIHTQLFTYKPKDRLLRLKTFDEPVYYMSFVFCIYMLLKEDDTAFSAYIKFVHSQWLACKTTNDNLFPNWLASPKMVKRFLNGERAKSTSLIITDVPRTYSSHTAVGASDDGEFDASDMW